MSGIVSKNAGRASGIVGAGAIGADAVDGSNIADDAIDSEHYTDGSIDNAHIADDAIDSEHYADGSIDNAHIADDAIDSEHYADGSIDNAHIADDAIDSEHYADGSIDNAHIADDAIDSEHYAAGSIDEAHIADNAVTLAKMAGGTDGNIISFDASGDPVAIATGTDGQVLTSTGAGSPPAFETAAGGGKVQQIVYTLDGDDANGTGTIPFDDTIVQNSEGTEFMTRAITPTSSSSVLRIDVITCLTHSVSNMCIKTALFKDSVANALAVSWMHMTSGSNYQIVTCLTHHIVAGSTSSQSFKVRCGGSSGTTYFNSRESTPTGQMFGAITQSSITITEYTP